MGIQKELHSLTNRLDNIERGLSIINQNINFISDIFVIFDNSIVTFEEIILNMPLPVSWF